MGDDFDRVLAVAVGGYLVLVFYNGNSYKLFEYLKGELGYLEFILAITIIYYLVKNDFTGFAGPLVGLAGLGIALQFAGVINVSDLTKRFADGEIGIFNLIKKSMS
jgi:hypothetical protein